MLGNLTLSSLVGLTGAGRIIRRRKVLRLVAGRRASVLSAVALACFGAPSIRADQVSVVIRVLSQPSGRAIVEGKCAPSRLWSFRNSYGSVLGLGSRIEQFRLVDAIGTSVSVRKVAPGEFESSAPASGFQYEVDLTPPTRATDAVLVSWLSAARGVLLLADLLPTFAQQSTADAPAAGARGQDDGQIRRPGVTAKFILPPGWTIYSNENPGTAGQFEVTDADRSVFVVGSGLRTARTRVSGMTLMLVAGGEWAFSDSDAVEMAAKVLKAHSDVFRSMPREHAMLILLPFPQSVASDKWSAETRGGTVSLLLGKQPSKTVALAQLSVPLTHELFHLWVPNGLALEGDYDWFYEGFTTYQAARTAIRLQLLTFQEFLNAVGRAYDTYVAAPEHDRRSLVEASQRRWTVGESVVYQKSMLAAFLYDLKLRSQSRGKHSLDDVYRQIFREYHAANANSNGVAAHAERQADGSRVAMAALNGADGMRDFASSLIEHARAIDLQAELAPFGLRVERVGLRTRVSVNEPLTRQQRDLLRELGYNDSKRVSRAEKSFLTRGP